MWNKTPCEEKGENTDITLDYEKKDEDEEENDRRKTIKVHSVN